MRRKYISTKVLLACLSNPIDTKKDIHAQLKETIAEHRRVKQNLEKLLAGKQNNLFAMAVKEAA